jgi:hypothetical protein
MTQKVAMVSHLDLLRYGRLGGPDLELAVHSACIIFTNLAATS